MLVRRILPLGGLAVLLGAIARNQQLPPAEADTWFHLRFGNEFLGDWAIRAPGHLGSYDTATWIPTQWLAQIGMAEAARIWGMAGVIWLTGAVILTIVGVLYLTCRATAASLPSAIATATGTLAALPGLSARPQLVSYLFIALTSAAWLSTFRTGRPHYWLIAVAWLWPMCHGMWPIGISLSVAAVLGLALERRVPRRAIVRLSVIPAGSLVAAAVTPLGFDTYRALVDVSGRIAVFAEWGPTDFRTPPAAILASMLVVVVVVGFRSASVPWPEVTLFVVALGWALYSLRTTPVAAVILTPLLARALQTLVPEGPPARRWERLALWGSVGGSCLLLALLAPQRAAHDVVPAWVDDRLETLPAGARVLNDWDSGSYFLYAHPGLNFVMHGYGDVFTDTELQRNVDVTRVSPGWDKLVQDLDPDVALVRTDSNLAYALTAHAGWSSIQSDDVYTLLEPTRARAEAP